MGPLLRIVLSRFESAGGVSSSPSTTIPGGRLPASISAWVAFRRVPPGDRLRPTE